MTLPPYEDGYPDEPSPDDEPTRPEGLRARVVSTALGELGADNWEKYCDGETAVHPGKRVAWCGIFALWVLHQCGLGKDLKWNYGGKKPGFLYALPRTNTPMPGDMAYFDQPYQHHAIVSSVEGDTFSTIDGNQAGDKVGQKTGLPKSAATAFYSIQPLIDGTLTV